MEMIFLKDAFSVRQIYFYRGIKLLSINEAKLLGISD